MSIVAAIMVPHPPLIVPQIGRGEERAISATVDAYEKAASFVAESAPETIVLTSPHSVMYADYFHISPGSHARGDFSRFGVSEVSFEVDYDTELVEAICGEAKTAQLPAGTKGERDANLDHGTMVPLYFINQKYTNYRLVRIGLSGLTLRNHFLFGQCIARAIEQLGRRVAFVASGDLSHKLKLEGPYGFHEAGPQYDERIMNVMGSADFPKLLEFDEKFCDDAAECGHRSFVIMSGALDGKRVHAERLSHEGTFGVGYGVCTYSVEN